MKQPKVIILGNLHEGLKNKNNHHLSDILVINSLRNTIDLPTRQLSILDPIIILDDMAFLDSGTIAIPACVSDHKATYVRLPSFHQHNLTILV